MPVSNKDTPTTAAAEAPGPGSGTDVFVSYASQDAAVATVIVEALESAGLTCWIAPRNVVPGEFYAGAIIRALGEARIFVLVLTERAVTSPHVLREVERTSAKRHPIVSMRIGSVALPPDLEYFLSASHWLEATATDLGSAVPKLVQAVQRLIAPPSAADRVRSTTHLFADPPAAKRPIRRLIQPLVALGAVIALGMGYFAVDRLWPATHRVSQRAIPTPTPINDPSAAAIADRSVAVLPFVDMSEKKDQEYFGDGMAEEILNLLVKVPDLKVIGRTSSFMFKGKADDLRKIGATLGVAYLVEGSVRRAGQHIRVTAELIDARDGAHRWSETYDRDVSDVLTVQREIATSLARALQLEVNASGHLRQRPAPNAEAYDSYLRGLHAWNRFDQSGYEEALVEFRHALAIDASFAPAAEELARTLLMQTLWGFVSPQTGHEQARAAAQAALRLNPKSALAHAVLGSIHTTYDYDWPAAERELKEAVALAPTDPHVLIFAADECLAIGRWNEAVRLTDAASAADPLHANIYEDSGEAYLRLGRLPEAEKAARRVLEITPTYAWGHYNLAVILLAEGKLESALAEVQREIAPDGRLVGSALAYQAMHRTREADSAFARFRTEYARDQPMLIAKVYAMRGQADEAFKWLDTAFARRDPDLWLFKGHFLLRSLEGDPRYKAFLRKMNLPE